MSLSHVDWVKTFVEKQNIFLLFFMILLKVSHRIKIIHFY